MSTRISCAARLLESFADKKNAGSLYRTTAETFSDSPSAQEALAAFLYAAGKKNDALGIWKKLAQRADVTLLLSIARTLDTRGENAAALEVLQGRLKDFGSDPSFLDQLVATALRMRRFEQALPWGKRRIELARSPTELEGGLAQMVAACQQCDKVEAQIAELKAAARPMPMTCLLAELLESVGRSGEADDLLRVPAGKGELLAVVEQVRLFTQRGEWTAAALCTRRLLELSGGRQSQHVRRLVELYQRDGRIDEALKWVETWKRITPGATAPWLAEVQMLRSQDRNDDCLNVLRKAIQRFERDEELRVQLAEAYQAAGKPREAERVYWRLYEEAADVELKLRWAAELAGVARQEGTLAPLVEEFRQRSRNNRQSIVPLLALAEIYRAAEDYENRRQSLLAATKLKPDDLQLLTQIARLEASEGDWQAALTTLEQAAKLDKTDQTRQQIVRLQMEYGDRDAGLAMLRDLLGEQGADPRTLERVADSLCGIKEWDRAVEMLRGGVARHPTDYRLRYLLAVACEEADQLAEAIAQFLPLLDHQEEPPGVKKSTSAGMSPLGQYADILRRLLPAEAMEWFEIAEQQGDAYSYCAGGGRIPLAGSASALSAQAAILPPPSADAVRPYALVHLVTLWRELDESQQAALVAKLKTHGIRSPKWLLKLGLEPSQEVPSLGEALAEDPDNEALLAITVLASIQQRQGGRPDDLLRAFKKFRGTRPQLALAAAVELAAAEKEPGKEYAKLFDEGIALGTKIDLPNPFLVMMLAQCVGGSSDSDSAPSGLDKEQRNKVVKLLVAWYPKMLKDNSSFGLWDSSLVLSALRSSDDVAAYFAMLEAEVAAWRQKPGRPSGSQSAVLLSGGDQRFLVPLAFPPSELVDFPPEISGLLSARSGDDASTDGLAAAPDWDAKKVEACVRKLKDPTLRVLAAFQHGLDKIVDATIAEMLARKPPSIDAYLLAAAKAQADSHFAKAIALLEKAGRLPLKQEVCRRIDIALVAGALAAKEADQRGEEILKPGRDAALRLRRQRLDQQQREQARRRAGRSRAEGRSRQARKASGARRGRPLLLQLCPHSISVTRQQRQDRDSRRFRQAGGGCAAARERSKGGRATIGLRRRHSVSVV